MCLTGSNYCIRSEQVNYTRSRPGTSTALHLIPLRMCNGVGVKINENTDTEMNKTRLSYITFHYISLQYLVWSVFISHFSKNKTFGCKDT